MQEKNSLKALTQVRKSGDETFRSKGDTSTFRLLEFWQWSASDLLSNATRGRLAEFLVAKALGVQGGIRTEWDAFDLLLPSGLKVEVKSCAYLQSWEQTKLSSITFRIGPTRAWNESIRSYALEVMRQADLYVFALLAHKNKLTVDALDLDQWLFYVIPTFQLDALVPAKSIRLVTVETLCSKASSWHELREAVCAVETVCVGRSKAI